MTEDRGPCQSSVPLFPWVASSCAPWTGWCPCSKGRVSLLFLCRSVGWRMPPFRFVGLLPPFPTVGSRVTVRIHQVCTLGFDASGVLSHPGFVPCFSRSIHPSVRRWIDCSRERVSQAAAKKLSISSLFVSGFKRGSTGDVRSGSIALERTRPG